MSDTESPNPLNLKEWFNEARYRSLAKLLKQLEPKFDLKKFLALTLDGLESRTLMPRMRQTSIACNAALSGSYRDKVAILQQLAPLLDHDFIALFLSDFVEQFGRSDFAFSMKALKYFTTFGSAEFAIRPFILDDQERTLQQMLEWTSDPHEKVRRLASEGCRPRLPWGQKLHALVRDPSPLAPILNALKDDSALFVRKSVANNLNDVTKDHPDWVLERLESWDLNSPRIAWIAKHACRTLIKKGHPRTMKLFGFGEAARVHATLSLQPTSISLGDSLHIAAEIISDSRKPQRLVIDYVIHYIKSNGSGSPKVFKWTEVELPPGATLLLKKRQTIKDFTTRKHFAGHHVVELQINGARVAAGHFILRR